MKLDTNTLLLIGAGVVAIYFVTKPATPTLPLGYNPYSTPAYNPYTGVPAGNTTAGVVAASGSALEGLSDLIGNFF